MFKTPEQYRVLVGAMKSTPQDGCNGVFKITKGYRSDYSIFCIVSDKLGWEHVSVSIKKRGKNVIPTWDEMCEVKDLFWDKGACVVQFHPPEQEYVNTHSKVLHLWRKEGENAGTPMKIMV